MWRVALAAMVLTLVSEGAIAAPASSPAATGAATHDDCPTQPTERQSVSADDNDEACGPMVLPILGLLALVLVAGVVGIGIVAAIGWTLFVLAAAVVAGILVAVCGEPAHKGKAWAVRGLLATIFAAPGLGMGVLAVWLFQPSWPWLVGGAVVLLVEVLFGLFVMWIIRQANRIARLLRAA